MKKLYFLNEEEKNRILNLHENATKRQYLGEATDTPELKIAKQFYEDGAYGPGTNPNNMVNAIQSITSAAQFWKVNELVKTLNSDKMDIAGVINDEFEYTDNDYSSNRKDLDKIIAKLKTLGIGATIKKGNLGGYLKGTFKINAQPNKAATDNAATDNAAPDKTTTEDKSKKVQQYKQQIITKTSDTTKQIQALLGLDQTGVMDSGLLQKINDKLNGGGTSTPASSTPASSTPASSPSPAYNFNVDPNIGKGGINFNQMTPEQIAQGVQSATPPQESIAATTPPTNKEKRQERRDLRAANRAEMQALRDKQRGNQ